MATSTCKPSLTTKSGCTEVDVQAQVALLARVGELANVLSSVTNSTPNALQQLQEQLKALRAENSALREDKAAQLEALRVENAALRDDNAALRKENAELQEISSSLHTEVRSLTRMAACGQNGVPNEASQTRSAASSSQGRHLGAAGSLSMSPLGAVLAQIRAGETPEASVSPDPTNNWREGGEREPVFQNCQVERRSLACAVPGCNFRVHSCPEFGGYCCIACCEEGPQIHGPNCEQAPVTNGALRAPYVWQPRSEADEEVDFEEALRRSIQERPINATGTDSIQAELQEAYRLAKQYFPDHSES